MTHDRLQQPRPGRGHVLGKFERFNKGRSDAAVLVQQLAPGRRAPPQENNINPKAFCDDNSTQAPHDHGKR